MAQILPNSLYEQGEIFNLLLNKELIFCKALVISSNPLNRCTDGFNLLTSPRAMPSLSFMGSI